MDPPQIFSISTRFFLMSSFLSEKYRVTVQNFIIIKEDLVELLKFDLYLKNTNPAI